LFLSTRLQFSPSFSFFLLTFLSISLSIV
jgi:hypothetical protein